MLQLTKTNKGVILDREELLSKKYTILLIFRKFQQQQKIDLKINIKSQVIKILILLLTN